MRLFIVYLRRGYDYCVSIPDKLYPFSEDIEGKKVRWQAAYDQALARIQEEHGYGTYGPKLIAYRGIFHVLGAVLFIFFSVLVSRDVVGSDGALYLLFFFAAAALLYQETYVQKNNFGQKLFHSFVDWFSWIIPMVVYIYAHTHNIELREILHMVANTFS